EGEVEEGAQRGQRTLLVPWCRPDAQLMLRTGCGERVGEDDGALLRQPQRRLAAAASVVEGDESTGKLAAGFDPLEVGHRDVVAEEEARTESTDVVALREEINVANMIGLEDNQRSRRIGINPLPKVSSIVRGSQRIEKQSLAARLHAG